MESCGELALMNHEAQETNTEAERCPKLNALILAVFAGHSMSTVDPCGLCTSDNYVHGRVGKAVAKCSHPIDVCAQRSSWPMRFDSLVWLRQEAAVPLHTCVPAAAVATGKMGNKTTMNPPDWPREC